MHHSRPEGDDNVHLDSVTNIATPFGSRVSKWFEKWKIQPKTIRKDNRKQMEMYKRLIWIAMNISVSSMVESPSRFSSVLNNKNKLRLILSDNVHIYNRTWHVNCALTLF